MALNNSEATERVLAQAIDLSRSWRHHYLGIEHVFAAACRLDGAIGASLGRFGVSITDLEKGILTLVPSGDESAPWEGMPQTPRYRRLMKTMVFEEAEAARALRLEPVHIVAAILREGRSVPCRYLLSKNVDLLTLRDDVRGKRAVGSEAASSSPSVSSDGAGMVANANAEAEKKGGGKAKLLMQYGRDLVDLARQGKIDPVIGRVDEVRRVLQVLTRKTKSNPVLIGEAGVGKTAVANGLAWRIAQGTVPDILKNRRLIELSLNSLVAGTGHRGEFEKRLQGIMDELTADPSIILFIDEIHQIVGAGESRGGMDAGNILKPALARGDFAVMGATTTDEYRRYIEADPALERRFQPVMVGEPSEEDAFEILKGLRPRYEQHHGVHFSDEALLAAVKMSVRFLPDRNLPDKAIDLIDESAARIKTRGTSFSAVGPGTQEVTPDIIAEVVADWTGIPVSRVANEEETRLLDMENLLRGRVVGQDHAVAAVASTIRVVRVGLSSPNRPAGVFLFLGPSGVGKTELAKTLAEYLFGSEREMVRLDMSEFHDKHSVARLIGAPPGYVGYEGEGQLTKAVRTKPFCVLLLDEVEKAHPDIFDIFLQVFDEGRLTDAKGRTVNFTNAIIIMTSNLGARGAFRDSVAAAGAQIEDEQAEPEPAKPTITHSDTGFVGQLDALPEAYQMALRIHFRPEFLNRIDEIVVFRRLKRDDLRVIVDIHLNKSIKRIRESRQVEVDIGQDAVELLLDKGYHPEFGARPLTRAVDTWLTRPFAEYLLRNKVSPGMRVHVYCDGDKLAFRVNTGQSMVDTMGRAGEPRPELPEEPRSKAGPLDFGQPAQRSSGEMPSWDTPSSGDRTGQSNENYGTPASSRAPRLDGYGRPVDGRTHNSQESYPSGQVGGVRERMPQGSAANQTGSAKSGGGQLPGNYRQAPVGPGYGPGVTSQDEPGRGRAYGQQADQAGYGRPDYQGYDPRARAQGYGPTRQSCRGNSGEYSTSDYDPRYGAASYEPRDRGYQEAASADYAQGGYDNRSGAEGYSSRSRGYQDGSAADYPQGGYDNRSISQGYDPRNQGCERGSAADYPQSDYDNRLGGAQGYDHRSQGYAPEAYQGQPPSAYSSRGTAQGCGPTGASYRNSQNNYAQPEDEPQAKFGQGYGTDADPGPDLSPDAEQPSGRGRSASLGGSSLVSRLNSSAYQDPASPDIRSRDDSYAQPEPGWHRSSEGPAVRPSEPSSPIESRQGISEPEPRVPRWRHSTEPEPSPLTPQAAPELPKLPELHPLPEDPGVPAAGSGPSSRGLKPDIPNYPGGFGGNTFGQRPPDFGGQSSAGSGGGPFSKRAVDSIRNRNKEDLP